MIKITPIVRRWISLCVLAGVGGASALLSACSGGSVATTPLPAASPAAVVLPTLAAPVTVPLANPSPGMPLTVSVPMGSGTASVSFPAGTTVTAGTSIVIKSVTVASVSFAQSSKRKGASANQPPTTLPLGPSPGLYVQVIDGLINVTNSGGASNFAAGQFGYVPNASRPPVLVPQNPGIKFTPPPAFNSPGTVVIPIGTSGLPGSPYDAFSDGNGGVVFPFSLTATTGATFVLASAANAPPSVAFLSSSTANVLVGATPATLALPQIDASLDASMTFGPTTGAGTTLQATFQTDPAPVSVTTSAHARSPQGIGGAFTAIDNVQISQLQTVSFAQTPAFTFGLGQPSPPVAGVSYYVVLYDVKNPSAGLTTIAGPGVVSGNTVTFASVAQATTLQANDTYIYELIQTTQTLATPTPTATAAPTASPTHTPTPAPVPTATPTPVPTATPAIATVSSTVVPSFGTLPIPVLSGVLNGDGSLSYNQTSTGSTQNMTVSASTGNFASLTTPAGQTALVYLTVGFPSGADLTFGSSFSPPSLYLAGTVFQLGSTYTVTFTLPNGTTLPSQTGVASFDDGPHGPGGVIFVNSPLQSLTLSANQTIGITVSH